jgi:hypothetical protein
MSGGERWSHKGNQIIDENGLAIATVHVAEDIPVIEAAPTLLATLEHIERACEPGVDQSDDALDSFIANVRNLARAAIKKAPPASGHFASLS